MSRTKFTVIWDNGHACGALHPSHYDHAEAKRQGENWRDEMIAMDPDPDEAAQVYSYEIIEEEE